MVSTPTEINPVKVRTMLPMSIRCDTCGNCICKDTKFNSLKYDVIGKVVLQVFKCTQCSALLSIKTDPQNSDFIVESAGTMSPDVEPGAERSGRN